MNFQRLNTSIIITAFLLFCIFVFGYEKHSRYLAQEELQNHARIISNALWNYNDKTAAEYLNLACRSEGYEHILIIDSSGKIFLEISGERLSGIDAFLSKTFLIRRIPLVSEITRGETVIGTIQAVAFRKTVYLYIYILFALAMLTTVFYLYTRLMNVNRDLEQRVRERTSELEDSNRSFQKEMQERLRTEDALKQSHETFLTVLDSIDATIFVSDFDSYEILFMNKYMQDQFGNDLEGELCWKSFRNNVGPCKNCIIKQLRDKNGSPTDVKVWEGKNTKTGQRYINYDRAIKWVNGKYVHLQISTDITRLKELENERIQTEAKFQQAQKMEAIGTLAGGIAHDFNNLLMGMLGNVSLLLMDMESTNPDHKRLMEIEKQILSGSRLTTQLLGYARKGIYELKPVNLNSIVLENVEAFGRTRKEINIKTDLDPDALTVEADRGQIEQVLLNILVNAADAMPEGGRLIVRTSNVIHEAITNKPYTPNPGQYALLSIQDTGIGMEKSVLDRIFDPFFTTKEMGRGTGLGLASSYGIIKGHNGYIEVESKPGEGTSFSIYLPITEKKVAVETPSLDVDKIVKGKGSILLVDDEPVIIDVGKEMLQCLGYTVFTANNGEAAIKRYMEAGDRIDMLILDMIMPDIGGGEVFDRLREFNPEVKVLLSSGYSIDGKASAIMERGCNGFIQKPFKLERLSQKIREIIG